MHSKWTCEFDELFMIKLEEHVHWVPCWLHQKDLSIKLVTLHWFHHWFGIRPPTIPWHQMTTFWLDFQLGKCRHLYMRYLWLLILWIIHLYLAAILAHLPLDKIATIYVDNMFSGIFMNETLCNLIKISLKFVPKGPVDNSPTLV